MLLESLQVCLMLAWCLSLEAVSRVLQRRLRIILTGCDPKRQRLDMDKAHPPMGGTARQALQKCWNGPFESTPSARMVSVESYTSQQVGRFHSEFHYTPPKPKINRTSSPNARLRDLRAAFKLQIAPKEAESIMQQKIAIQTELNRRNLIRLPARPIEWVWLEESQIACTNQQRSAQGQLELLADLTWLKQLAIQPH